MMNFKKYSREYYNYKIDGDVRIFNTITTSYYDVYKLIR